MDLHVFYLASGLESLASDPRIRRLIDEGILMLVLWQELPRTPHLPYEIQVGMGLTPEIVGECCHLREFI